MFCRAHVAVLREPCDEGDVWMKFVVRAASCGKLPFSCGVECHAETNDELKPETTHNQAFVRGQVTGTGNVMLAMRLGPVLKAAREVILCKCARSSDELRV